MRPRSLMMCGHSHKSHPSRGTPMPPIPMLELRAHVLSLYSLTGRKPATIGRIDQMFTELAGALGRSATTEALTTAGMMVWLGLYAPLRSPETTIGHLSNLRTICAMALEEGWIERVPAWKRLRPRRRRLTEKRHHSRHELATLLDYLRERAQLGTHVSRRLQAAVAIAIYCGLRRDELLFLRLADVDLAAGIVWVVPHAERGLKTDGAERPVPIPPELAEILAGYLPHAGPVYLFTGIRRGRPWHGGRVGHRPVDELRGACVACGIAPGTWQWLRRAWATHAESAWFLNDGAIERVMGHTSPKTSKVWYRNWDLDNLRAIGKRITYQV
jgi:integrase